jgi:ketosteroid isomerase-like protein
MSQKNIEVVRRIYDEGWIDRETDEFLSIVSPEVEFVNPPEAVDPGTRYGLPGMIRAIRNAQEAFEHARHELRDLFGADDLVVAAVAFRARGRGSDVEVFQEEAHTWTFRDDRIVRFEWGRDLEAALRAAGLPEQDVPA